MGPSVSLACARLILGSCDERILTVRAATSLDVGDATLEMQSPCYLGGQLRRAHDLDFLTLS